MYDGGDLRLAVIVRHHYAAVHAAVMAGEFRAFVAQFAGEVLAVDDRRIAAAFDVHQEHRLHVAWRRHCRKRKCLVTLRISVPSFKGLSRCLRIVLYLGSVCREWVRNRVSRRDCWIQKGETDEPGQSWSGS